MQQGFAGDDSRDTCVCSPHAVGGALCASVSGSSDELLSAAPFSVSRRLPPYTQKMPFTVKNAAAAASTKRPSEGAASDESPAKRAAAPLYANLTLLDAPKRNSVQRLPPSAPVVLCAYKVLLAIGESVPVSEKEHDRSPTELATSGPTMKAWWTPPCSKCRSTTQPAQVPWTFGQLASHLSMIEFARWVHSRYCVRSQGKFQRLLERCEQ